MRRGVWVVLGLVGVVPVGALAQQAARQPTEQAQGGSGQAGSATGGSAQSSGLIEASGQGYGPVGSSGLTGDPATMLAPEQAGTASPDDTSGIRLEIPKGGVRFPGIEGERLSAAKQARAGTGGSGRGPSRSAGSTVPNEQIFVGTVRSATRDRLLMEDPNQRVYEFSLGERTRIICPNGAAVSLQALREGTPVRTVTRAGEFENQVLTLQVLGRAGGG